MLIVLLSWLVSWSYAEEPVTFVGTEFSGAPCSLTVHNPESSKAEKGWLAFELLVSTPWQSTAHAPILVRHSETPDALYGRSTSDADQIAVEFTIPRLASLNNLRAFTFQTWDENRKLYQAHCRNLHLK